MYKLFFLSLLSSFIVYGEPADSLLNPSEKAYKQIAALPLECILQEYPNKLNQVLTDSSYLQSPKELHPVFYGCFDWHSSVHGHWLLASMLNKFPDAAWTTEIIQLFDQQFTHENMQAELRYFEPKLEKSFERTYGWAWLLKLQTELEKADSIHHKNWSVEVKPLCDFIVKSYQNYLPKLVYPVRNGEHTNTAFGLSLAYDYAMTQHDKSFQDFLKEHTLRLFMQDCNCPINYEPGGSDFLSPCLQTAELMSKILPDEEFETWIKIFLPSITKKKFNLIPGTVLDRTDGKLVHLDGLNFARAWCLYAIARKLPALHDNLFQLADAHVMASSGYVLGSDYMGSHWLASFLVLALEERGK